MKLKYWILWPQSSPHKWVAGNHTAIMKLTRTRTTRTPAFWGYPPPPHDYPYHWVMLDPKSKEVKISNFWILKRALHVTHLPKLLDKTCKYEMDPISIVEDTERTRFCPQTDRRTRWYQYTPYQLRWSGGYNNSILFQNVFYPGLVLAFQYC